MFGVNAGIASPDFRYLIPELHGWYDFSNAASLRVNGSNQTSQANDLSQYGNNATQTTTANQPVYTTNAVNGLSALYFNDTAEQFLQLPNGILLDGNNPYTFFCVVHLPLTNAYVSGILDIGDLGTDSANTAIAIDNAGIARNWWWDNGSADVTMSANTTTILEYIYNPIVGRSSFANGIAGSVDYQTNLNLVQIASDAAIGRAFYDDSVSGGYEEYCKGYICEVVISRALVSDFIRTKVRYLLAKKWGVSL